MLLPWVTGAGLLALMNRKIRRFRLREIASFALRIAFASAVSALAGAWLGNACARLAHSGPVSSGIIEIAAGGLLSLTLYYWLSTLLGFPEARKTREFVDHAIRASVSFAFGGAACH
jgi:hypothetical protein